MDPLPEKPTLPIEYRTPAVEKKAPSQSEIVFGLFCALLAALGLLMGIAFGWSAISIVPFGPGPGTVTFVGLACLCFFGTVVMFRAARRLFRGRE